VVVTVLLVVVDVVLLVVFAVVGGLGGVTVRLKDPLAPPQEPA